MQFLFTIIIKLGLTKPKLFLRTLIKLEYGVSAFCSKISAEAYNQGYFNLSSLLETHAKEENKHGLMLGALADGQNKILLRGTGRWLSFKNVHTGIELATLPEPSTPGKVIFMPEKNILGIFQNLDGLSQRYLSLRLLFRGKKAADFDWCDRIAFMCALEHISQQFYAKLADIADEPLKAIALQISQDELEHSDYLKYTLTSMSNLPSQDIKKWEGRIGWSMLGLVFDVWRLWGEAI